MSTGMQAIEVKDGSLQWRETEPPRVGPRDVRIAVTASGVNRADLLQRRGLYPPPKRARPPVADTSFPGTDGLPKCKAGACDSVEFEGRIEASRRREPATLAPSVAFGPR